MSTKRIKYARIKNTLVERSITLQGERFNMKRLVIIMSMIVICLTGCSAKETTLNIKHGSSDVSVEKIGAKSLKEIGGGLYYDVTTGIVYWWNGSIDSGAQSATTPSVYYAQNGLPYKYNPTNNTLEEINNGGTI